MNCQKRYLVFFAMLLCFMPNQLIYADLPSSVEISDLSSSIQVGDPLILKIVFKFTEPQTDPRTGTIYSTISHSSPLLIEAKKHDENWFLPDYDDYIATDNDGIKYYALSLFPSRLDVQDTKGLTYSGYFIVLYNHHKKGIIFDRPGIYKIVVQFAEKSFSNNLEINVTPKSPEINPCILSDPNEYYFLAGTVSQLFKDPKYRSKVMTDLETLVEQCPDSILAKWAVARIGLESFYDAEKKRTKARREKIKLDKTNWDDAGRYLQKGLQLPDDFPIRREVLYRLIEIEHKKKNYSKALSYLDELATKYPKGKYGKQASEHKKELIKLFTFTIEAPKLNIKQGEAFFLDINLKNPQHEVLDEASKFLTSVKYDGWIVQTQNMDIEEQLSYRLSLPLTFHLKNAKELEYTARTDVFCHVSKAKNKLTKKIIFEKAGRYTIQIKKGKNISNTLHLTVEPSVLGEKALSLLSDPEDFAFLQGGVYKSAETVEHLKEVVLKCKGTELSQMAAARLGLEYFKDFQKAHPSLEKFKVKRKQAGIEEPIFNQASTYLALGVKLSDEYPIREEVLHQMIKIEFVNGNYYKAISFSDELATKYPKGKYGKKASKYKKELIKLQQKELQQKKSE